MTRPNGVLSGVEHWTIPVIQCGIRAGHPCESRNRSHPPPRRSQDRRNVPWATLRRAMDRSEPPAPRPDPGGGEPDRDGTQEDRLTSRLAAAEVHRWFRQLWDGCSVAQPVCGGMAFAAGRVDPEDMMTRRLAATDQDLLMVTAGGDHIAPHGKRCLSTNSSQARRYSTSTARATHRLIRRVRRGVRSGRSRPFGSSGARRHRSENQEEKP